MAEEDTKAREDKSRKDAEERERADAEKLDMLLKGIDSLRSDIASCNSRMDAWDEGKKEPEEKKADEGEPEAEDVKAERMAADKAKKDAEEEEKEEAKKADAARADSVDEVRQLLARQSEEIKRLSALVRQPVPESFLAELTAAQARADDVQIQLGSRAPQPMFGESPLAYRRRLAGDLAKYSDRWKGIKLDSLDAATFEQVESQVYADAAVRARTPNDIAPGRMREVRKTLASGHVVTEFYGADSFVKGFSRPARRVRGIRTGN